MQVTVVCVNAGDYLGRGVDYVNALFSSVIMHSRRPLQFICLVDPDGMLRAKEYNFGITLRPLPAGLKGWWNKLAMFRPTMLPRGPIVYIDLDTIITGDITPLLDYRGKFAMLRDFMRPTTSPRASGVMAWNNRQELGIWEAYEAEGRPTPPPDEAGDQEFIAKHVETADLLQNIMDGIYSYKIHCKDGLPSDARLVCFHGLPRPHQVNDEWVTRHTGGVWQKKHSHG